MGGGALVQGLVLSGYCKLVSCDAGLSPATRSTGFQRSAFVVFESRCATNEHRAALPCYQISCILRFIWLPDCGHYSAHLHPALCPSPCPVPLTLNPSPYAVPLDVYPACIRAMGGRARGLPGGFPQQHAVWWPSSPVQAGAPQRQGLAADAAAVPAGRWVRKCKQGHATHCKAIPCTAHDRQAAGTAGSCWYC